MLPTIWPGDVLSIEPKSREEILPGGIVLVASGWTVLHPSSDREAQFNVDHPWRFPTQDDAPVAELQVLGKVSMIHRKNGDAAPKPRLSPLSRMLAIMCRWDPFRNTALRLHSLVATPPRRLSWWRPRPHWRGEDTARCLRYQNRDEAGG